MLKKLTMGVLLAVSMHALMACGGSDGAGAASSESTGTSGSTTAQCVLGTATINNCKVN